MASKKDLENQVEMEVLNSKEAEKASGDTNDAPHKATLHLEKDDSPPASFAHIMEEKIKHFYHMLKVLTLLLAPILILLFVIYNFYANAKKEVPPEVITTLTKVMSGQMGGHFSHMFEDPSKSSSIQKSP